MRPLDMERSVGLDRLATWNEVRYALSFSSQCIIEVAGTRDDSGKCDLISAVVLATFQKTICGWRL